MSGMRPYHCSPAPPGNTRSRTHGIGILLKGRIVRCKPGFCPSCDEHPTDEICRTLTGYKEGLTDEVEKLQWLGPLNSPMVVDFINCSLALYQADRWLQHLGHWNPRRREDGRAEIQINPVLEQRHKLSARVERLSQALGITPKDRLEIEDRLRREGDEDLVGKYTEAQATAIEEGTDGDGI